MRRILWILWYPHTLRKCCKGNSGLVMHMSDLARAQDAADEGGGGENLVTSQRAIPRGKPP